MQRKNLKLIQGEGFDLIENLLKNWTKYLFTFDYSREKFQTPHIL